MLFSTGFMSRFQVIIYREGAILIARTLDEKTTFFFLLIKNEEEFGDELTE